MYEKQGARALPWSFQEKKKRGLGLFHEEKIELGLIFFIFLLFLFLSLILFKPLENKLEFETKVERSDRSSFNIISLFETKKKNIFNIPKLFLS